MKAPGASDNKIEITLLTKTGGPLTKSISLNADGTIKSDGSACLMARGMAARLAITDAAELARIIDQLKPAQALALGALRAGLPNEVKVVTKAKLNGATQDVIARSGDDITYRERLPAFALIDFDAKGMPRAVAARIDDLGGFWAALLTVLPELKDTERVTRASTGAGLTRADTGEELPGSGGLHVYPKVKDGADIERFLRTLHERCWLAGLGWMMVGAAGQLLERSIVDRMVAGPERLVFEGGADSEAAAAAGSR